MASLIELVLTISAIIWLPALVLAATEPQAESGFLTTGALRGVVLLTGALVTCGWQALVGELAVVAAGGAWLVSGQLPALLAHRKPLRSQVIVLIAAIQGPPGRWWHYLQLFLLDVLTDVPAPRATVPSTAGYDCADRDLAHDAPYADDDPPEPGQI